MAKPAPLYDHASEETADYGWPQPRTERRVHTLPQPETRPRRRRRARTDRLVLLLALLGLVAAAAAAAWYLTLDTAPAATEKVVPSVVGMREKAAVAKLTGMGFNVRAVERPGPGVPGSVFSQRPSATTSLARGATVTIRVANGQKPQAAQKARKPAKP